MPALTRNHCSTNARPRYIRSQGFDSVYSDLHANKDTESFLRPGSLVPMSDERVATAPPEKHESAGRNTSCNAVLPAAALGRDARRNPLLPADKPLMPCRTVLAIGFGPHNAPGRSIDF